MARRDPVGIRLLTRNGNDWSARFPLVVEAVNHLNVHSCLIDGEVVCCDERGLAIFSTLRQRRNEARAFLFAFDLLEMDGLDMRREPIETRKATLASLLRKGMPGVRLNEHLAHSNGAAVFHHACKMGAGGDCLEAPRLALPVGPFARLAQVQEPAGASGEARGGRGLGKMREDSDLGQLGAFSRNRAVTSFSALDRSNTGSAKNTPKSDMDLLARIQHLASLNWASHRMARGAPQVAPPDQALVHGCRSAYYSPTAISYVCRAVKDDGSNIGGPLELMIRNGARPWHS